MGKTSLTKSMRLTASPLLSSTTRRAITTCASSPTMPTVRAARSTCPSRFRPHLPRRQPLLCWRQPRMPSRPQPGRLFKLPTPFRRRRARKPAQLRLPTPARPRQCSGNASGAGHRNADRQRQRNRRRPHGDQRQRNEAAQATTAQINAATQTADALIAQQATATAAARRPPRRHREPQRFRRR